MHHASPPPPPRPNPSWGKPPPPSLKTEKETLRVAVIHQNYRCKVVMGASHITLGLGPPTLLRGPCLLLSYKSIYSDIFIEIHASVNSFIAMVSFHAIWSITDKIQKHFGFGLGKVIKLQKPREN